MTDDVYDLCWYTNGGCLPRFIACDSKSKISLEIKNAYQITFVLYATTGALDDNALISCSAIGFVNIANEITANRWYDLKDIDGNQQARIRFGASLRLKPPGPVGPGKASKTISKQLIASDEHWYDADSTSYDPQNQIFYETITYHGAIPLVGMPLLSTMTVVDSALLLHLVLLSCDLCGIDDIGSCDDYELGNLIGTTLTFLSGCHLYVNDFTRGPGKKKILDELWSALLTYPELDTAAFDCEDGALEILAVAHCLTLHESPYAVVQALQKQIRRYSFASVQGELLTDSGYVGHSFVVGFDSRQVDGWIAERSSDEWSSATLPPLLLESTAWQESCWDESRWRTKDYQSFYQGSNRLESMIARGSPLVQRVVRVYTSLRLANEKGFYGKVAKAQFASHKGQVLCVAITDSHGKMNVKLRDWLVGSDYQIEVISHLTDSRALKEELQEFPLWKLPSFGDVPVPKKKSKSTNKMQCRSLDWTLVKDEVIGLLGGTAADVEIFGPDHCSFVVVET